MQQGNGKKSFYFSSHRIAFLGVLISASLLTFMLENLLPPLFLPGAKLGLANIFTLVTLIVFSPIEAFVLVLVRTTLGCLIVGNPFAIVYSLTAGIISLILSCILIRFIPKISIIAVSVVGAVAHNITQNTIFCFLSDTPQMYAYTPYLALIGVLSGIIVGFCVYAVVHKLPVNFYKKLYREIQGGTN